MMRRFLLLVVALVLLGLWLPSPVLAAQYSITAPVAIDLLTFSAATDYTSADFDVITSTNDKGMSTVDIGVADTSGNAGYLMNGAAVALTNPLQAKGGDVTAYTDVTATDIMLVTGGILASGYTFYDFSVQQTIVAGDLMKPPGVYSTTLTFTATFNP